MEIIKPDTPNLKRYKLGEFEMATPDAPIKALQRALAMVDQLMMQQGNFGTKVENPFHLEPAAQYIFMMVANKFEEYQLTIEELNNRIAALEADASETSALQ